MLKVVGDLSEEQLRWRPTPTAHSIAWTLWHIARADDNVAADLTAQSIWQRGGYAARWGHPERGVGTGWDDQRAASLPLPPKDELLGFVHEVFDAVDQARDRIDESRVGQEIDSIFTSGRTTVNDVVMAELVHDNRHLGELEYIKGLLGLPGTATR